MWSRSRDQSKAPGCADIVLCGMTELSSLSMAVVGELFTNRARCQCLAQSLQTLRHWHYGNAGAFMRPKNNHYSLRFIYYTKEAHKTVTVKSITYLALCARAYVPYMRPCAGSMGTKRGTRDSPFLCKLRSRLERRKRGKATSIDN